MSPILRLARPSLLKSSLASLLAAAAVLASPADVHAALVVLQNDGFVEDGSVGFQNGFAAGERGAVTLGPVAEAFQINKVQLLFGPSGGPETVNLMIFLDQGGDDPGTLLFEGEFDIQPSADAISELDIAVEGIQVASGSIRVALAFLHSGAPSIARDDDGSIQPGRNWIYTGGAWFDASDFGVSGDWIIRAEIDTLGSGVSSTASGVTTGVTTGATTGSSTGSGETTTSSGPTSTGAGSGGTVTSAGAGGSGAAVCAPGETQTCVGIGSCEGGQACLADGSGWSTCECGDAGGNGSGGGGESAEDDGGCGCLVPGASPSGGALTFAGAAMLAALAVARRRPRKRG